jgi:hypothetical protein
MKTYPFQVPSGINIIPQISGAGIGGVSIGSTSLPFASMTAQTGTYATLSIGGQLTSASGATFSSTVSGTSFIGDTTMLNFIIDGGGSVISSGSAGSVEIPYNATALSWDMFANLSGSLSVDVRRATYANWSGTGATYGSIVGSEKPTITTAFKNQDTSLTTWSGISAGDIINFWVDATPTNITRATLAIKLRKNS